MLATEGLLGPGLIAAHCVYADAEEIDPPRRERSRSRALPSLERLPRCGVAPVEELLVRGVAFGRDRQPGIDAVARHVRGDPSGDRRRPRP